MSISHGETFARVHSPAAVWIQSVSARGFEVCARETGTGTNGTGIINWLAFQDQPQMAQGSVTLKGIWTTETKCHKVMFKQVRPLELTLFAKLFRQQFLGVLSVATLLLYLFKGAIITISGPIYRALAEDLLCSSPLSTLEVRSLKMRCMLGWKMWILRVLKCASGNFLPFDGKHQDTIVVGKCIQIFYFSSFEL